MTTETYLDVPFPAPLTAQDREQLEYRLNYLAGVSTEIGADVVRVRIEDPSAEADVTEQVRAILGSLRGRKQNPTKVLFRSRRSEPVHGGEAWPELLRSGQVFEESRGLVGAGPLVSRLLEAFDDRFCEIAEEFGAVPHTYPSLISAEALERCGHFDSFPQHVAFVSHMTEDPRAFDRFAADWKGPDRRATLDRYLEPAGCVLSPAVCYHTYLAHQGQRLDATRVVTALGKCFRYEAGNMRGLERLWDFTMREIVFMGTAQAVEELRQRSLEKLRAMLDELELVGHVEVASDPFFTSEAAAKRAYQMGFELKYELRLGVPGQDRTIAVASFNVHEEHFGRQFSIGLPDGQPAATGCTAFGLERWVYAFLCQWGLEPSRWPPALARAAEGARGEGARR